MSAGTPPFPPDDGSLGSPPFRPDDGLPGTPPFPPDDGSAGTPGPLRTPMVSAGRRSADTASREKPPRDLVRTIARGLGQTLITAGLIVLLFVVYEVWITDLFSGQKQAAATQQLDAAWTPNPTAATTAATTTTTSTAAEAPRTRSGTATGTQIVTVTDPNQAVSDPKARKRTYETFTGRGFAKIYIPSFGADYVYTVIEGTNSDDLDVGPGHYADTQYPGEAGNFAMAGHRVSKGSPFNELGQLSSCDAMVIETRDDWFVYRVLPMDSEVTSWKAAAHPHCIGVAPLTGSYHDVFGREITVPSDYAQVLPIPHVNSSAIPTNAQRLITLTTCHPQFSDTQRMIIHGVLVRSYQKAAGFLPSELKEG